MKLRNIMIVNMSFKRKIFKIKMKKRKKNYVYTEQKKEFKSNFKELLNRFKTIFHFQQILL